MKKIGCWSALLIIIIPLILFIGYLFYYAKFERNYIKVDSFKTITIWNNYIIFDKYWYPFYPKKNFIHIDNTREEFYEVSFTLTQDSILGIWCTQPIEVCCIEEIKAVDKFNGYKKRKDWADRYSFAKVTEERQDSLQLEFCFSLYYPCALVKGMCMYAYKTDTTVVQKSFD